LLLIYFSVFVFLIYILYNDIIDHEILINIYVHNALRARNKLPIS